VEKSGGDGDDDAWANLSGLIACAKYLLCWIAIFALPRGVSFSNSSSNEWWRWVLFGGFASWIFPKANDSGWKWEDRSCRKKCWKQRQQHYRSLLR